MIINNIIITIKILKITNNTIINNITGIIIIISIIITINILKITNKFIKNKRTLNIKNNIIR